MVLMRTYRELGKEEALIYPMRGEYNWVVSMFGNLTHYNMWSVLDVIDNLSNFMKREEVDWGKNGWKEKIIFVKQAMRYMSERSAVYVGMKDSSDEVLQNSIVIGKHPEKALVETTNYSYSFSIL